MRTTLATIKSYIRKNPNLYISTKSSFDGMVDCVMPCDDQTFTPIQTTVRHHQNTLGIQGAWFVLGGDDK